MKEVTLSKKTPARSESFTAAINDRGELVFNEGTYSHTE